MTAQPRQNARPGGVLAEEPMPRIAVAHLRRHHPRLDRHDPAERAAAADLDRIAHGRVPTVLEERAHRQAPLVRPVRDGPQVGGGERPGLLEQHRLAGLHRRVQDVGAEVVTCTDHQRCDFRPRQQFVNARRHGLHLGRALAERVGILVGDSAQVNRRDLREHFQGLDVHGRMRVGRRDHPHFDGQGIGVGHDLASSCSLVPLAVPLSAVHRAARFSLHALPRRSGPRAPMRCQPDDIRAGSL